MLNSYIFKQITKTLMMFFVILNLIFGSDGKKHVQDKKKPLLSVSGIQKFVPILENHRNENVLLFPVNLYHFKHYVKYDESEVLKHYVEYDKGETLEHYVEYDERESLKRYEKYDEGEVQLSKNHKHGVKCKNFTTNFHIMGVLYTDDKENTTIITHTGQLKCLDNIQKISDLFDFIHEIKTEQINKVNLNVNHRYHINKKYSITYKSFNYYKVFLKGAFTVDSTWKRKFYLRDKSVKERLFMNTGGKFKAILRKVSDKEYFFVAIPLLPDSENVTCNRFMLYLIPKSNCDLEELLVDILYKKGNDIPHLITTTKPVNILFSVPEIKNMACKVEFSRHIPKQGDVNITCISMLNILPSPEKPSVPKRITATLKKVVFNIVADRPYISLVFDLDTKEVLLLFKDSGDEVAETIDSLPIINSELD